MRVNLITKVSPASGPRIGTVPVSLLIKPSCGLPGDYTYPTDSDALVKMLYKQTDLAKPVVERFESEMRTYPSARLLGVDLNDRVLKQIGYFID